MTKALSTLTEYATVTVIICLIVVTVSLSAAVVFTVGEYVLAVWAGHITLPGMRPL